MTLPSQVVSILKKFRKSAHKDGKLVNPKHRPALSPEGNTDTHFCQRLSRTQYHSALGRIKSMKNCNDPIGNQTRDFLIFSAVP